MITKTTDDKGRIVLGQRFANKTFIIEEVNESEIRIVEAAVVPVRELWLQANHEAQQSLLRGLEQAKQKSFVAAPDLEADAKRFGDQD